jgi:hypothetical protein
MGCQGRTSLLIENGQVSFKGNKRWTRRTECYESLQPVPASGHRRENQDKENFYISCPSQLSLWRPSTRWLCRVVGALAISGYCLTGPNSPDVTEPSLALVAGKLHRTK